MTKDTRHNYRLLYALLNAAGMTAHKGELVASVTGGRTESASDMTAHEFSALTEWLREQAAQTAAKMDRGRKKIFSLCYTYGLTMFSPSKGRDVVDTAALNAWMLKYGYLHKPLNDYKPNELPKLITQFESMVVKHLKTM